MRTPRFRAAADVCSAAVSTAARMSSGRRSSRTSPESSFESSSRFCASQSSRSICWPLDSRNSVRASGSSRGALLEQVVEGPERGQRGAQLVRDVRQEVAVAIAVAADDLDALLDAVGHRVELDRQLGDLRRAGRGPGASAPVGARSPSARPRAASVSWRSGVVNRRASQAETSTLRPSAKSAMTASSPVTLPIAWARKVYGFDSVTRTAYGPQTVPPVTVYGIDGRRFLGLAVRRSDAERGEERAVRRRHEGRDLAARGQLSELDPDVGLSEVVGDDVLDPRVGHGLRRRRG